MKRNIVILLIILPVLSGCASVTTEAHKDAAGASVEKISFPPYSGEPLDVQIVEFSIPAETLTRYPELNDQRVGWGMCSRIIDICYESGRFSFIEEKESMRDKILENWKMKASGITIDEDDFEIGTLQTPDYFIYAEIYDFAIRQNEKVVAGAAEEEKTTIIGIQLRLLDSESGKFIPASGIGEASSFSQSIWMNADLPFDQSTVGLSTERAVRAAVLKLIERIK